jgi:hypothetical protein
VAKDKDEIPDFDHLHIDGLEPAAQHPAAQPGEQLPDPSPHAGEAPTIDFVVQEPGTEPSVAASGEPALVPPEGPAAEHAPGETPADAPAGEPAPDILGEFGVESAPTGEAHAEGEPGEIEFGISGEAGEEIKSEEEPAPEVSEEELADAADGRKLRVAAMVLVALGGLGIVAGFVLAFLKEVSTWLAVLIGVHYAALPALLLALGLFLFFAVKKAGGTATLDSIKQGRVYEAVLAVAFLALWIAGFCLLGELSSYGYDVKATTAPRSAPPAAS